MMETYLAWKLVLKRPVGLILQILALCMGLVTAGVAMSLYGALASHGSVVGAHCADKARWVSIRDSSGYWHSRFTFKQVEALGSVLGFPVYPVVNYSSKVFIDNKAMKSSVVGIDSDALSALCVSPEAGHLPSNDEAGALVGASLNSDIIHMGTQDIPVVGEGTKFRGFHPATDPVNIFLPLNTLAKSGFDVKAIGMPVMNLFISLRTAGHLPSDNDLTLLVRQRPDVFPDVSLVHLSRNLGHAGKVDFSLEEYSRVLGMLGLALLFMGLVNVATYQLSRQADLSWRSKVLYDLGATPLALRRLTYVEPLVVLLASTVIAGLLLFPLLHAITYLLDLPIHAADLGQTVFSFLAMLGLALVVAILLGELRYRIASITRSRRVRRLIQGYFTYGSIVQTFACVITVALAISAIGGYVKAASGSPKYNLDHVRVYSMALSVDHKPQGMAARWEGVLGPLGTKVHGVAAASLFLLPLPVSYGYGSNGISYGDRKIIAAANNVTPDYFKVLQLPLASGRMFGYEDLPTVPRKEGNVAVINSKLAERLGLGVDAANHIPLKMKSYLVSVHGNETADIHTIGVVDEGSSGNNNPASTLYLGPDIYLPMPDFSDRVGFYYLLVRYAKGMHVAAVDNLAKKSINELTPYATIRWVKSLRDIYDSATASERSLATLFGVLGVGMAALVACGIFGIGLYSLELNRQSLAVRFSMGATLPSLMLHQVVLVSMPLMIGVFVGVLTFIFFGGVDVAFMAEPVLPLWAISLISALIVMSLVAMVGVVTGRMLRGADFHEWLRTE